MNDEEFIIKFYSCDNQEQFLKDVYHNLNCLQNQVEKLTQENNDLESKYESKNDEYIKAMFKIMDLQEEKEHLESVIDKAVNYVDENRFDLELPSVYERLLKILRSKE